MNHFSASKSILLLGEGDFSFSVCLAKRFNSARKMVATSLDSEEMLTSKYSMAPANLKILKEAACTILHEVDATKLHKHPLLRHRRFDRIVFNFPHAGYKWTWEHNPQQIKLHQTLVSSFFSSACGLLEMKGKVYVTHKTAHPFNKWEIEELAKNAGLMMFEKSPFKRSEFPGYMNKKGDGPNSNKTFPVGECSLYKFAVK